MNMPLNTLTLEFIDDELESKWQHEAGLRLQTSINWATILVATILVLSIIRDLILQWDGWEALMAFRIFIITPFVLSPWLLSKSTIGSRHKADIVLICLSGMILAMGVMLIWLPVIPGASKALISVLFLPVFFQQRLLYFQLVFGGTWYWERLGSSHFVLHILKSTHPFYELA